MKIKTAALGVFLIAFAAAIIAFPQKYVPVCFQGFCTWAESVLPSLFPFMVVTGLLIKSGFAQTAARPFSSVCGKLGLPKEAAPLFFMSVCSGYPAGSRVLAEYCKNGMITETDCKKLAPLCSTAGPLFITGTVGFKAFGGGYAGVKLLFGCLFSVIVSSIIYSLLNKKQLSSPKPLASGNKRENVLYESFYGAVTAVCLAGGFIAFFYTLARVLQDFKILAPLGFALTPLFGEEVASALCLGLCEATGGCFALASAGGFFALPLAGFLITFGGISIILQQTCYLTSCGIKTVNFAAFKFLQGTLCFCVICLLQLLGL